MLIIFCCKVKKKQCTKLLKPKEKSFCLKIAFLKICDVCVFHPPTQFFTILNCFFTVFNRFFTIFHHFQPFQPFSQFSTVLHRCYYPQTLRDSVYRMRDFFLHMAQKQDKTPSKFGLDFSMHFQKFDKSAFENRGCLCLFSSLLCL